MQVLAVDPGRGKCGIAILSPGGKLRERRVVARDAVFDYLVAFYERYGAYILVVGDRTGSKEFLQDLERSEVRRHIDKVCIVDEHLSTLEARERYFVDHPPKGFKRLIPRSMLTPPVAIDDYVAVILAERFLQHGC